MAKQQNSKKPTEAELAILNVIWDRGSATVREVFRHLGETQGTGYTTVLKFMQIMTDKGLLERDSSVRPQVYKASRPRKQTQKLMVRELLDKAFGGSAGNLALQALSIRKSSPEELREIRAMLDKLEGRDA
jgi:predicted transcriptional regulator